MKFEISGGRIKVKKLAVAVIVIFVLGLLLVACGGSKRTTSADQNSVQSGATKTVQTVATAENSGKKLDVVGKTCLTAGTYKVTSKDLGEAFVNSFCSELAKGKVSGPDDDPASSPQPKEGFKSAGELNFDSVKIEQTGSRGDLVDFLVSFKNCADCPREFKGNVHFYLNQLDEWQLSGNIIFFETKESGQAKVLREVKVTHLSTDVRLGPVNTEPETDISVTGGPLKFYILCQFDDGNLTELSRFQDKNNQTYSWQVNNPPPEWTTVKVVAYSFEKYGFKTDPIYLNK